MTRLARWLGPWADPARAPEGITRERIRIGGEVDAWLYTPPRRPRGAWLVTPGLHFLGADDPRMDRFCRILASIGNTVLSPSLPDHRALRVSTRAADHLRLALDELCRRSGVRPAIFSISFGSFPAIRTASDPRVAGLVVFGGFADLRDAIEYATRGEGDPLNKPAVYLNVEPDTPVVDSLLLYCRETWGREEMKRGGWREVAERISLAVVEHHRPHFRRGTGLDPHDVDFARHDLSIFDPAPDAKRVTCPVWIFHGVDDDVIPVSHAPRLAAMFPRARLHLTGFYGHSEKSGVRLSAFAKELATMASMLHALASASKGTATPRTS